MIPVTASTAKTPAAYGLFPAAGFRLTTGECRDCASIAQALWFFRDEWIAVPGRGLAVAGFDPKQRGIDDLRCWQERTPPGSVLDAPALVWVGSPHLIESARLDATGARLSTGEGVVGFDVAARLPANRAYFNADSLAFLARRELRLRGTFDADRVGAVPPRRFVARTLWPADFRVDPAAPLQPIAPTVTAIRAWVRSEARGGARSAFATRLVWQRDAQATAQRCGRPLIALMLNGAQGDDDEAHGGHFGLCTGRVGDSGAMHDWLIANFYTLDYESEKGIIAAMLPLDNYLADLNSGQAWYRPSYLLVATLRDERTAAHLASALGRVFNHFYRHQFVYRHASANCAGISLSTLRALGWRVPLLGPTSWWRALIALPVASLTSGHLAKGRAAFDYFSEERTRLLPALAFEQAGADLMRLAGGQAGRPLTPFEALLARDVDEILLLRIPQLPSSRAWGDYPVVSLDEYQARLPRDPAQRQIVPVAPRRFPDELRDSQMPRPERQRSDYALAAGALCLLLFAVMAWRGWRRRPGARHA